MLTEILNAIKNGSTVSVEDLSVRLNSPPGNNRGRAGTACKDGVSLPVLYQ